MRVLDGCFGTFIYLCGRERERERRDIGVFDGDSGTSIYFRGRERETSVSCMAVLVR